MYHPFLVAIMIATDYFVLIVVSREIFSYFSKHNVLCPYLWSNKTFVILIVNVIFYHCIH